MRLVQPGDQSDVGARVTQRSDLHPHDASPCGTTDVRHDELDAHALCFSPMGHALLSTARRFVRSTQNLRRSEWNCVELWEKYGLGALVT